MTIRIPIAAARIGKLIWYGVLLAGVALRAEGFEVQMRDAFSPAALAWPAVPAPAPTSNTPTCHDMGVSFPCSGMAMPSPPAVPAPVPAATVIPTPVAAPAAFPGQYYLDLAQYCSKCAPHYSDTVAAGKLLSASGGTYSFSGLSGYIDSKRRLVTAATAGLAQYMRSIGPVSLYAVGAAGAAASAASGAGGTILGAAANGGVLATGVIGKSDWTYNVLIQIITANGSTNWTLGAGIGWKGK